MKKEQEKPENRKKTNTSTKVTIDKNKKLLLRGVLKKCGEKNRY